MTISEATPDYPGREEFVKDIQAAKAAGMLIRARGLARYLAQQDALNLDDHEDVLDERPNMVSPAFGLSLRDAERYMTRDE